MLETIMIIFGIMVCMLPILIICLIAYRGKLNLHKMQIWMQLYDKGVISAEQLTELTGTTFDGHTFNSSEEPLTVAVAESSVEIPTESQTPEEPEEPEEVTDRYDIMDLE